MYRYPEEYRDNLVDFSKEELVARECFQKEQIDKNIREIVYYDSFSGPVAETAIPQEADSESMFEKALSCVSPCDGGSICVVLLMDRTTAEILARGVSIRSPRDSNYKILARIRARGRAIRAMHKRKDSGYVEIREGKNFRALEYVFFEFGYKSIFKPKHLSEGELALILKLKI